MPWWATLLEMIGLPALKFALVLLEQKYPGLTPIIQKILEFISGAENPKAATQAMSEHVDMVCSGVACPPHLKS